MATGEKKAPDFDAEKVDLLLDIVVSVANMPALVHIREAAMLQLHAIDKEIQDELYPQDEEEAA